MRGSGNAPPRSSCAPRAAARICYLHELRSRLSLRGREAEPRVFQAAATSGVEQAPLIRMVRLPPPCLQLEPRG
jgi:hypothetical protein